MNPTRATPSAPKTRSPPMEGWTETLRNGTPVRIRPLGPHDLMAQASFFDRLTPRTRHNRFLGGVNPRGARELSRLCSNDPDCGMAFVATIHPDGREIGVCRFARNGAKDRAEIALVVADHWQHKGLGTLMLSHLIDQARSCGIVELHSRDWADNEPMRRLAREFGFRESPDPDDPALVIHSLDLTLST